LLLEDSHLRAALRQMVSDGGTDDAGTRDHYAVGPGFGGSEAESGNDGSRKQFQQRTPVHKFSSVEQLSTARRRSGEPTFCLHLRFKYTAIGHD
jgi:hypothetical protein